MRDQHGPVVVLPTDPRPLLPSTSTTSSSPSGSAPSTTKTAEPAGPVGGVCDEPPAATDRACGRRGDRGWLPHAAATDDPQPVLARSPPPPNANSSPTWAFWPSWCWPHATTGPKRRARRRLAALAAGESGTGKSHLLIALGTAAARTWLSGQVHAGVEAGHELAEAPTRGSWPGPSPATVALTSVSLDELGYLSLDRRGAELLFEVLTEREEKASIAVTAAMTVQFVDQDLHRPSALRRHLDRLTYTPQSSNRHRVPTAVLSTSSPTTLDRLNGRRSEDGGLAHTSPTFGDGARRLGARLHLVRRNLNEDRSCGVSIRFWIAGCRCACNAPPCE